MWHVRPTEESHLKDQYFCDVNDYRKYGLLRCFAEAGFRVGVCWMLTAPDESNDGRKVDYLDAPQKWRHRDPPLFDFLKRSLDANQLGVRFLEDANLLPGAVYFSELLQDDEAHRQVYFERALAALKGADLLFFDPDTGLEVPAASWGRKASCGCLYWSEVRKAASSGASIIIFQHWKREHRQQTLARLADTLRATINGAAILPIDSPSVAFLTACRLVHRERYAVALRLMRERWSGDLEAK
jgi:hypothetical protein